MKYFRQTFFYLKYYFFYSVSFYICLTPLVS
uniref:Uncharacterized protein n=1 Tax=Anguilla anguilla TaxID=7936 RepID=A0A0E9TCU7_ANGAN